MPYKDPEKKRANGRECDARRMQKQSAKGNLYRVHHAEENAAYQRKYKELTKGLYAEEIARRRNPIIIEADLAFLGCDFHIPFHDTDLLSKLCDHGKELGKPLFICAGDFWDCDTYTKYSNEIGIMEPFEQEIIHVGDVIKRLKRSFSNIIFTKGNHEKRWIDLNNGNMTMEHLFGLTRIHTGYQTTMDSFMNLIQEGQNWLIGHPKAYSQTPLQVANRIASKYHCHVALGHSHLQAQGWDLSGKYQVCDLGGMFHQPSLDYQRELTRHPMNKSGYYVLENNQLALIKGGD